MNLEGQLSAFIEKQMKAHGASPSQGYLNPHEAAKYLNLSHYTLRNWRCLGQGPRFIRKGRLIRYKKSDLDCWMLSNTK